VRPGPVRAADDGLGPLPIAPAAGRAVAIIALGLWSALAGGTLMGAMWGWMATADQQVQLKKLASLPRGAKPADVDLKPIVAVLFFVKLDQFGRHLGYLTILIPLVATDLIVRKALAEGSAEKPKPPDPESELFTPHGP
jgi:hypothetical protein